MGLRESTAVWDIIPDTHGHTAKLEGLLARLGYVERRGAYRNQNASRRALFLGDFIDRGSHNARVIDIARRMTGEGEALAIMGNHELNALQFATPHPDTGQPLRPHTPKNLLQHEAFLAEFPLGSPEAQDVLGWMMELPLFLDLDDFRAVHACWHDPSIMKLRAAACPRDRLTPELLVRSAKNGADEFRNAVETIVKGPETQLPEGYGFHDKGGHFRTMVRLAWWNSEATDWKSITASVPDPEDCLPTATPPAEVLGAAYPSDAPPVFFGHYWLQGTPMAQSANALCLDYSVGLGGPLLAYTHPVGSSELDLGRITAFG